MAISKTTLNAKVAAFGFPIGALGIHILHQLDASLIPLKLLSIGILIFGVWAFSDEMGLRKPLNRAAFVGFIFSMGALLFVTLQPEQLNSQYFLIYSFGLLFSVLAWSAAFLHRQKSMKLVGSLGAAASLLPILVLIGGHISIGFGAVFGLNLLFNLPSGSSLLGSPVLNTIEAIFVLWALFASVSLLSGSIRNTAANL